MDDKTIKGRIRSIRASMRSKKLDCLIITTPENVNYTTGFTGHDSWVLVTSRAVILFTDSRYTEQAIGECVGCRIVERRGSMAAAIAKAIERVKTAKTAGLEDRSPVTALNALRKHVKIKVKPASGIVESARCIKDSAEVKAITKASQIAWRGLAMTLPQVKPGVTEIEAASILDFNIRQLGSSNSFETIMAFGPNASRPHHQPGKRKLRANDSILIDFGARYNGYCSDTTRCFVVGKASGLYRRAYSAVFAAQQAAIKKAAPGVKISDIDAAARNILTDCDMPQYGHGTGHGLGLEVHESPIVSAGSKTALEPGQVITIEPGIYIPGKLGIRIEDDILITESGCKVLSKDRKFRFSEDNVPVLDRRYISSLKAALT